MGVWLCVCVCVCVGGWVGVGVVWCGGVWCVYVYVLCARLHYCDVAAYENHSSVL